MALEQPPPEEEDPFLAWYHAVAGVPQQQVQTSEGTIVGSGPTLPPLDPPPPPPPAPKKFDRGEPMPDEVPMASSSPRDTTVAGEPAPKPSELGEVNPSPPSIFDAIRGAAAIAPDTLHERLANPIAGHYVEPMAPPPLDAQVQPGLPGYLEQQDAKANELPLPSERNAVTEQADKEQAFGLAKNPAELARQDQLAEQDRNTHMVSEALRLSAEDAACQQQLVEAHVRARVALQQDRDKLAADAQAFANNPQPPVGIAQGIANVIALTLGGAMSSYTGGRNLALEQLNKQIDAYQQAQTHAFSVRQQGIASNEQAEADDYRDQQAFRVGVYQRAMNDLQTQMQNYNPRGSMVRQLAHTYQSIAAAQQGALQSADEKMFERRLKVEGAWQKQQEIDETKRAHDLEYDAKMAKMKGKGAGEGSATNPNYTVATGFFDPISNEPVFGKREIGGKGKEKERETIGAQIANYGHVQAYWDKLHKIGQEIGFAKTAGESVWKARRDTLGAEYDAAREALTVYLTKELGDKLTQGQLEAQAHRIPERANLFEARDPGKQVEAAQEDADHDFLVDMNTVGINASPVIASARSRRADRPQPNPDDAINAAQQAVSTARNPTEKKDAEAALDAAKQQMAGQVDRERQAQQAVAVAKTLEPAHPEVSAGNDLPGVEAAYRARNEAADTYNQELAKYHKLQAEGATAASSKTKSKLKGDVAAAQKKHEAAIAEQALAVVNARQTLDKAARDIDFTRQHEHDQHYQAPPPLPTEEPRFK